MDAAQANIMTDGAWTTEPFTQANLNDLQDSLNVSFTFPLTQMGSAITPEDGMGNSTFDTGGLFDTISPRSRYVSLDLGRSDIHELQDSGFFLPLSKSKSLSHDAKENAREVSGQCCVQLVDKYSIVVQLLELVSLGSGLWSADPTVANLHLHPDPAVPTSETSCNQTVPACMSRC